MSRSVKKNSFSSICSVRNGEVKKAKTKANRIIRKLEEELPKGNYYRRIVNRYHFPDDGKMFFADDKSKRK